MKGCSSGMHNPEKPKQPAATQSPEVSDLYKCLELTQVYVPPTAQPITKPTPKAKIERPSADAPFIAIKLVVSPSLKNALEALKKKAIATTSEASGDSGTLSIGIILSIFSELCIYWLLFQLL